MLRCRLGNSILDAPLVKLAAGRRERVPVLTPLYSTMPRLLHITAVGAACSAAEVALVDAEPDCTIFSQGKTLLRSRLAQHLLTLRWQRLLQL